MSIRDDFTHEQLLVMHRTALSNIYEFMKEKRIIEEKAETYLILFAETGNNEYNADRASLLTFQYEVERVSKLLDQYYAERKVERSDDEGSEGA